MWKKSQQHILLKTADTTNKIKLSDVIVSFKYYTVLLNCISYSLPTSSLLLF